MVADVATAVSGEIAERLQDQADLVEVIGDRVAAGVHPGLEPRRFPFQPERALGPARMGLAFGATVARMVLQCCATLLDVALNFRVDTDLPAAFAIKINLAEPSAEGGGQVAPGSCIFRVEVLADLHPATD